MKDHLGNVRLVFSDLKDTVAGSSHYKLDVRAVNNYYPFGMLMPDMSWQSSGYRYGFGGHEMDNDVKGTGNHSSFGDYGYDVRTVRRYMLEPMISKYPSLSPYVAYADNPVLFKDPDGREIFLYGIDGLKAAEALKAKTCLDISYDPITQKVEITGKPQTLYDVILLEMSKRTDIKVYLQTTREEKVTTMIEKKELEVLIGAFDGNIYLKDGKTIMAMQYINMENSKKLEDGGLSTQGTDVLHELLEAYLYALKNPNMGHFEIEWDISHKDAIFFDPEARELGRAANFNTKSNTYELLMYDVSIPEVTVKIKNITKEDYDNYLKEDIEKSKKQTKDNEYNDTPIAPDPRRKENGD